MDPSVSQHSMFFQNSPPSDNLSFYICLWFTKASLSAWLFCSAHDSRLLFSLWCSSSDIQFQLLPRRWQFTQKAKGATAWWQASVLCDTLTHIMAYGQSVVLTVNCVLGRPPQCTNYTPDAFLTLNFWLCCYEIKGEQHTRACRINHNKMKSEYIPFIVTRVLIWSQL